MAGKNTREMILEAALELFSVYGFEATSTAQIAEAVGIKKASLYSHFTSKQDILDTLINESLKNMDEHSIFALADKREQLINKDKSKLNAAEIYKMVQEQIKYVLHDPFVSRARRILIIEQFQNPDLALLHSKQSYEDVFVYCVGLMKYLISNDVLVDMDPEIMAAQFAFPISEWANLCDHEPNREEEVMRLIERHIKQFFEVYKLEVNKTNEY